MYVTIVLLSNDITLFKLAYQSLVLELSCVHLKIFNLSLLRIHGTPKKV